MDIKGNPNNNIRPGIPNKPEDEKLNLSISTFEDKIGIPPTAK